MVIIMDATSLGDVVVMQFGGHNDSASHGGYAMVGTASLSGGMMVIA